MNLRSEEAKTAVTGSICEEIFAYSSAPRGVGTGLSIVAARAQHDLRVSGGDTIPGEIAGLHFGVSR